MKQPETRLVNKDSAKSGTLYMAMELSNRQWKLGFTDRRYKIRRLTIEARNPLKKWESKIGVSSRIITYISIS